VPYQLVGVISPWNGPLMLSCLDPVPALFAGSAVIVKPSEVAPRFVEPLMETIRAVPELAEVFTFITGDGQTGQQLIRQKAVMTQSAPPAPHPRPANPPAPPRLVCAFERFYRGQKRKRAHPISP
jgi:acyl-CoA reductase-like NAD-dependent aldehyde dehydrogenase